jgi:hypothetical protein
VQCIDGIEVERLRKENAMTGNKWLTSRKVTTTDAALDGLFSGVVAGLAMTSYLAVWGLVAGEGPGTVLSYFASDSGDRPLVGALTQLAVSGVYGILFGVGRQFARRFRYSLPTTISGVAYSLALLILSRMMIASNTTSPLLQVPLIHFALAHVIYGLILARMIVRITDRTS